MTNRNGMDVSPNHILMIVPHEPELDPRIKWVTGLCAGIASTHIIACVDTGTKLLLEVDGTVTVERVNCREQAVGEINAASSGAITTGDKPSRNGKQPAQRNTTAKWLSMIASKLAFPIYRFILIWKYNRRIIKALDARLATLPFIPGVIVCHDLLALAAGVKVKRRCHAPIIYDSHEFWPEADLQATRWQQKAMALIERRWIRQADQVITVTPGLARALEQLYGLSGVLAVPNAEPLAGAPSPFFESPAALPVKFLLQGQVTPGRGIEEFLGAWSCLNDERCILILRAPENDYLAGLRKKFKREIGYGRIRFALPVPEPDLIVAARAADVGIIPYGGPSINHIHACPNKLSQYMQAGLAILYNADLMFVGQVVERNQCGRSYRMDDLQDFYRAIRFFLDHPEELVKMRINAHRVIQTEFNWEIQSKPYEQVIRELLAQGMVPEPALRKAASRQS